MAISIGSLKKSGRTKPDKWVIFGPAGVGKTTLAAGAPNPVFLWVEKGAGRLKVDGWDIGSYGEVMEALGVLYSDEHDRRTVVIDSLDWLEKLIWDETCERNGWKTLEDPGYGKGYLAALRVWGEYLEGVEALRNEREMTVLQVAHAEVKRFDNPETEPYDRYGIKLHRLAAARISEDADVIGFLNYRVSIAKADVGFNKKVNRAVGGGQRILRLNESPACLAKQRLGMPDVIDLPSIDEAWSHPEEVWAEVAQYIPEPESMKE